MRRRLAGLVAAGAATALVLSACGGEGDGGETTSGGFEDCVENPNECNSGERRDGGEITWTLDQAASGYFPWSAAGGSVYTLQAMWGILPYFGMHDPSGEYQYNLDVLAAEPEMVSEDPLATVWQINPEAVWNDGTPVNANDVIITWMMSSPEGDGFCEGCQPRSTSGWDIIENIEGSDDGKTVTVTYEEGAGDPEWFAFGSADNIIGGFAPAHVAQQQGFIEGDDPADWDPAGLGEYFTYLDENPPEFSAGPYQIESFDLDSEVVKVPNPNWYGEVQPTLDRVVIRFLTEEASWVPALQNGELHGGSPAGWAPDVVEQVQQLGNVRVHMQPGPSWEHLDMNLDNRWLADVELRRAIFTVIDAQAIIDRNFSAQFPDATRRTNHIFRFDSPYHEDKLAGTGQGTGDLELAREILAAAGYEGYEEGAGPLTLDGEQVGPLRLRTTTAPARETATQLIQSYLGDIGIEVNLEPTDDLGATLSSQDYDMIEFGWSGSPLFAGNGAQFWETGGASNFGNYSNEQVDALAERERQVNSQEESAELHNQMMDIVVNDAYVLPLYDSPVYVFVTDEYVNVRDNTNESLRALYQHHAWGLAAE